MMIMVQGTQLYANVQQYKNSTGRLSCERNEIRKKKAGNVYVCARVREKSNEA